MLRNAKINLYKKIKLKTLTCLRGLRKILKKKTSKLPSQSILEKRIFPPSFEELIGTPKPPEPSITIPNINMNKIAKEIFDRCKELKKSVFRKIEKAKILNLNSQLS